MRLTGKKDGVEFETILDHHICTEEDYASFPDPAPEAQMVPFQMLNKRKSGLLCINLENYRDELLLWGQYTTSNDY